MIKKIRHTITQIVSRGLSPKDLALGVALGCAAGLFPVLGTTTLLCLAAATLFRLNVPVVQAVNWLIMPLQLLLIVPLMKFGASLLGMDSGILTVERLTALSNSGLLFSLAEIGSLVVAGILAWGLLSVPLTAAVYLATLGVIRLVRGPRAILAVVDPVETSERVG